MLETRAIVVHTDNRSALVQASQGSSCSACDGKGCGSSKLNQLFCNRPRQFKVDNPVDARVGDEVIVSVAEGTVIKGIGLVYLLPLLLLFVGAALANSLASDPALRDAYAATGALTGLLAGFAVAKWFSVQRSRQLPSIASIFHE